MAEAAHVQVALGAPGLADDVAQPRADEQYGGVAVGEGADGAGPAADLAQKNVRNETYVTWISQHSEIEDLQTIEAD